MVYNRCDNCPAIFNPDQVDFNADGTGDRCDLDDGYLDVRFARGSRLVWQRERSTVVGWNVYRGDLDLVLAHQLYTQTPADSPLAEQFCGLSAAALDDPDVPPAGKAMHYLVTELEGGLEGSLGTTSAGAPRPNDHPCP